MAYSIEPIRMNNGKYIPSIGFGTSLVTGDECVRIIKKAIDIGYTHIDTAHVYKNETEIGKAIKESNVKREKIFITSKVWKDSMGYENTIKSFNETLNNLDLDYIDLFLIHWPKNNDEKLNIDTWKAMENLYKEGKVKSIGVSNFLQKHLKIIIDNCKVLPAVNQIEFHPGLVRKDTIEFCRKNDIVIEAWAPLGKGKMLNNEKLSRLAKKYNKSVAQICLKWCLQNNVIPLPKSQNSERMKQNLDIFDFEISVEDMNEVDNIEFFAGSDMNPNTFN